MTAEKMPHEIYLSSQFGGTVGFEPFAGAVKYVRAEPASDTPGGVDEAVREIENVCNQLQFSSMARAGDYSEPNQSDMKMEAAWAGTLLRALNLLRTESKT